MAAVKSGKEAAVMGMVENKQEATAVAAEMVAHLQVDILVAVESHGNTFVEPLLVAVQ